VADSRLSRIRDPGNVGCGCCDYTSRSCAKPQCRCGSSLFMRQTALKRMVFDFGDRFFAFVLRVLTASPGRHAQFVALLMAAYAAFSVSLLTRSFNSTLGRKRGISSVDSIGRLAIL
jgi:hypothetical protein